MSEQSVKSRLAAYGVAIEHNGDNQPHTLRYEGQSIGTSTVFEAIQLLALLDNVACCKEAAA